MIRGQVGCVSKAAQSHYLNGLKARPNATTLAASSSAGRDIWTTGMEGLRIGKHDPKRDENTMIQAWKRDDHTSGQLT